MLSQPEEWKRLVDNLDTWGAAHEVPDGLVVDVPGSPGAGRTVHVVVSPRGWDDRSSVMFGTRDED